VPLLIGSGDGIKIPDGCVRQNVVIQLLNADLDGLTLKLRGPADEDCTTRLSCHDNNEIGSARGTIPELD
jgi:hypothetical protein